MIGTAHVSGLMFSVFKIHAAVGRYDRPEDQVYKVSWRREDGQRQRNSAAEIQRVGNSAGSSKYPSPLIVECGHQETDPARSQEPKQSGSLLSLLAMGDLQVVQCRNCCICGRQRFHPVLVCKRPCAVRDVIRKYS